MITKTEQKIVPIDVKNVDVKKKKPTTNKSVFEIFQDGEWVEVSIREIKKDQIFRMTQSGNSNFGQAYKDASLDLEHGWGIEYSPFFL